MDKITEHLDTFGAKAAIFSVILLIWSGFLAMSFLTGEAVHRKHLIFVVCILITWIVPPIIAIMFLIGNAKYIKNSADAHIEVLWKTARKELEDEVAKLVIDLKKNYSL